MQMAVAESVVAAFDPSAFGDAHRLRRAAVAALGENKLPAS
jgi:hypothetical protein